MNSPRYIIMTASTYMPASCWGRYGKVAVARLEDGFEGRPKMISERARGVAEIVALWDPCNIGKTPRCAYQRALAEARDMIEALS